MYSLHYQFHDVHRFYLSSQPLEIRRVDIDEESYFNGDDEEDEGDSVPGPHPPAPTPAFPALTSPPLSRFQFAQKRRRARTPGIPLRTGLASVTQRASAPPPATPIHLPRTPPISALVDYGDDDEQSSDPEDALLESLVSPKAPPTSAVSSAAAAATTTTTTISSSTTTNTPPSSSISNTAIAANTSPPGAGTGTGGSSGFVPLRAEKRRRAEEDEDEMGLERLVSGKPKRPIRTGPTGTAEEGPKRIRLRFGPASLAAARSESGAKDGDTG